MIYGFGGPTLSHFLLGSWVGGSGLSVGSIVTFRGFGIFPPRGPLSIYSPGLAGVSPGFCSFLDMGIPYEKSEHRGVGRVD